MIVPTSAEITRAINQLASPTPFCGGDMALADQQAELCIAVPGASNDFIAGYELGLQTARVVHDARGSI